MGHEVRHVPANWQHPTQPGRSTTQLIHIPLMRGPYSERVRAWDEGKAQWDAGFIATYAGTWEPRKITGAADDTFEAWDGPRPVASDYMPEWPDEQKTHFMMYETISEGTPISPAFATPELLALWLVTNPPNSWAGRGATYAQWLAVCHGRYAPTFVMNLDTREIRSGVEL